MVVSSAHVNLDSRVILNDNVPKFERDSYSIEFSEDAKIGKDGDTNSGNFTHPPTPCPPLVLFIIKLVQTRSGQYLPEVTSGRYWGPPTHFHHRLMFRCAPFNYIFSNRCK